MSGLRRQFVYSHSDLALDEEIPMPQFLTRLWWTTTGCRFGWQSTTRNGQQVRSVKLQCRRSAHSSIHFVARMS